MRYRSIGRILVMLVAMATLLPAAAAQREDISFGETTIEIVSGDRVHRMRVQLATTPAQHARGLMFRRTLAPWAGMLFDFGTPRVARMWMRNTPLALDILFIRADGEIESIGYGVPLSEAEIASRERVRAVLELERGTARLLGIAPGDKVRHAIFDTPAGR